MEEENTIKKLFKALKKNLKHTNKEDTAQIIQSVKALNDKAEKLGQERLVNKLDTKYALTKKELTNAVPKGYSDYIDLEDINEYISKMNEGNLRHVKLINIEDYTRDIPDEPAKKIEEAKDIFDDIFILFTDFTNEMEDEIEKEKDPIAFGSMATTTKDHYGRDMVVQSSRMFVITDWEDEYCDLTLDKFISEYSQNVGKKDVVKNIEDEI